MNDNGAFNQIYNTVQPMLRRFLVARLGNEADADDVVQDTFVKLQQSLQSEVVENPKALAFSIARNLSVDLIRKNSRAKAREAAYSETKVDRAGEDLVDPTPNAEQDVAGREQMERLMSAIEDLSPKVRRAFVLHKIEGYSYAEVAGIMGLSKSTVEKHMIKALRRLGAILK